MAERSPARRSDPTPARLSRLRAVLEAEGWDALIVSHLPNIRWLTGFTGSSALLLAGGDEVRFLTDFRYQEQVRDEVRSVPVEIVSRTLREGAVEVVRRMGWRKVAVEADHMTVRMLSELGADLSGKVRLVSARDAVGELRMVKDPAEIAAIREAVLLSSRTYDSILGEIRPGRRELDLALEIETGMRRRGSEGPAFPTIVASGWRSALPHGKASDKKLAKNEFVIVDMGARLHGYHSDMTRTVYLGRPGPDETRIYDCVREAHHACVEGVRPGMTSRQADALARDVIEKAGYGSLFGHGTGHGIGLEVHEAPRLHHSAADVVLREGMVFTVEPGIYVPGMGGVRIEDVVVLGEHGAETLTPNTRNLIRR